MGDLPADWSLPTIDETNRAWFTSGSLAIQKCRECSTLQHPPEEICHACGSMTFDVEVLAPRGTVHSYTVVHYPAHPDLADAVPYTVALVSLDEAPHLRVVGNIDGPVEIGMSVAPHWDHRTMPDGTDVLLPQWHRR